MLCEYTWKLLRNYSKAVTANTFFDTLYVENHSDIQFSLPVYRASITLQGSIDSSYTVISPYLGV
jgi:hypothetical protein